MRRIVTWCVVGAIAALGLAAGIDALRGGEEPEPASAVEPEVTTTAPREPRERTLAVAGADLRRAGVPEGRLLYSDERCGAHVVLLPDLAVRPAHDVTTCRPGRSGLAIVASPDDTIRVECTRGRLLLLAGAFDNPDLYARERGCAAAWKPDGTVTFVQDGGIRRFVRCSGDAPTAPLLCSEPVLTRAELARQLPGAHWRAAGPRFKELRWLDDERLAAIVQGRTPEERLDYLALFDREQLVNEPVGPYGELGEIKPSPTGSRVAAFETERGGVVAIDRTGRQIRLALESGQGIAWSPDENWIAEATEGGIYVWRADDEIPDLIQIPVAARDVVWTEP